MLLHATITSNYSYANPLCDLLPHDSRFLGPK